MNTKHISLAFAAAAVAALLAGCAKSSVEEVNPAEQFTDLELSSVNATATKAAIDGTNFPENGEIGLFLFKDQAATTPYGQSGYTNVKYSYNSNKSKWTADPSIKVGSTPGYLYGYYPYNSKTASINAIPVLSSLNGDDVMYAANQEAITDKTAANTTITMNHALARVSITVVNKGYTGNAKLSSIKFADAEIAESGTLNAVDGSITATKAEAVTLSVPDTLQTIATGNGTTYECLLVPSAVEADRQNVTLTLTIDDYDKTANLTGNNGVIIAQNTKSNITINLSNTGISVKTVSVEDWNVVEVGGHKVTVKLDEGAPGIEEDVLVTAYAKNGNAVIEAYSKSGKQITCQLDNDSIVRPEITGNISKFVIPVESKDIVATIGVWGEGGRREITIGGHKINVVYDEVKDIEEDVWMMAYAENGNAVIEAESSSDNPVKCVKDGERIAGSKTGTLYKFTISDITEDATITVGYSKYTATIGFTSGSVTDKATLKINGEEVEAGGSISVFEGTDVEYSSVVDDGYLVLGWYDNDNKGQKVSDAESFTVRNINSDVAYYAEVKAVCELTVNTISAGTSTIAANGVSIESGRAYYYVQNTPITLTASPTTGCQFVEWCDADGKTLSTENSYSFTLSSSLTITAVFVPQDALSGVFTVSDDGNGNVKKVRFSKGNLWYGNAGDAGEATFKFEANQYDTKPSSNGDRDENHISHFMWCADTTNAMTLKYDDKWNNDVTFFAGKNFTVNGYSGWSVLTGGSNGEWKYLINYNNECGTTVRSGKYKDGVTVCEKNNCLVLLPDDWKWGENGVGTDWQDGGYPETSTDKVTWQTMEKAGAVCLPAASFRNGSTGSAYVDNVGNYGYYWSASPYKGNLACGLNFDSGKVYPNSYNARNRAQSVRLVTESK